MKATNSASNVPAAEVRPIVADESLGLIDHCQIASRNARSPGVGGLACWPWHVGHSGNWSFGRRGAARLDGGRRAAAGVAAGGLIGA